MNNESVNRREFGKKLAVGAAAVGFVSETADAAEETHEDEKQPKAEQQPVEEKPASEAELLLDVIKQRYPNENLTEDVLRQIRGNIGGHIGRGRGLSSFPLKNADEPGTVFSAYRAEG